MKKNIYLLLLAIISCAGKSIGQTTLPCKTFDMRDKYLQEYPQIATFEKQLDKDISNYIAHHDAPAAVSRKTSTHLSDTDYYDIPVVVHVIHDNGIELLADNKIYNLIAEMNRFYSLQNDVSPVIAAFKPYIGKAKFTFHLATKDPNGKPTKGITHRLSYLTVGGDDQAKFDQWNPANYVNIWFEAIVGQKIPNGVIVAYATQPPTAAAAPYRDGIISNYSFIADGQGSGASGGSIDHEMGHIMNLDHTFGKTNNPGTNKSGACTDDDGVDDTPPTDGNLGGCHLNDTICAANYFKIYLNVSGGDSLVNYPDTANEQNIMNYADCKYMFTKGQVQRMRGALNSDVGHRDSLWSEYNLALTGALAPIPDLPPVTDFCVKNSSLKEATYFTCPGNGSAAASEVNFISQCWGDTVMSVNWSFTNGATTPIASASVSPTTVINAASTVKNSFDTPGWASVTLSATGNNSGTTTTTYPKAIFVADKVGTPADGYFMDFNNSDTAKWPMFNYYNNEFKWQYANVGMFDNSSIEYVGYDSRGFSPTGSPMGDYDDFFSMPMDLTSFAGTQCNLNYFYSGASRTNNAYDVNDHLEIYYSIDRSATWHLLGDTIMKARLCNKGGIATAYTPTSIFDWAPMSIPIPANVRTNYTVFRFRYKPNLSMGVAGYIDLGGGSVPSGNNFFMDRIHFSQWPAEVSNTHLGNLDVAVVPNPTSGDAYVVIKDADNATAKIIVSDITGKQVYTVNQQISGNQANVKIPHEVISVAGMYMVQTITGNQSRTQKLVVY